LYYLKGQFLIVVEGFRAWGRTWKPFAESIALTIQILPE
jgi:hypothetical protein